MAAGYLLEAVNDTAWRPGYVFAAQRCLLDCRLSVWAHPSLTFVYALLAQIARSGVDASVPGPCGTRTSPFARTLTHLGATADLHKGRAPGP